MKPENTTDQAIHIEKVFANVPYEGRSTKSESQEVTSSSPRKSTSERTKTGNSRRGRLGRPGRPRSASGKPCFIAGQAKQTKKSQKEKIQKKGLEGPHAPPPFPGEKNILVREVKEVLDNKAR